MQTAQQVVAHSRHQSEGFPLGRCGKSFSVVKQAYVIAWAEHAVGFAAAGVPVGETGTIEPLRGHGEGGFIKRLIWLKACCCV